MSEAKKWYKSRTLWVNGLLVVAGVAAAIADNLATGGTLTAIGIINIILRIVTKTAVK